MIETRVDRLAHLLARVREQKQKRLKRAGISSQRDAKITGIWKALNNAPGPGHGQGGNHRQPDPEADILDRVRKANDELSERRRRR